MFSNQDFPERFAIIRTQGDNGPYLQILQAESLREFEGDTPICFFQDISVNPNTNFEVIRMQMNDRNIYQVYAVFSGARTNEVFYYWYIPYTLRMNGENIQIIDFQYKAWLPMSRSRVLILRTEGYNLIDAANEKAICVCESIHAGIAERRPSPPSTPPRNSPSVPARSPPRTSPSQHRPLPSNVGQILIRNARLQSGSCPITYANYSEINRLSITSCFHIFDISALQSWQNLGNLTCPLCRERMENIVNEEFNT